MALVSKKLYESWYNEDTFIRRNFFYIFKNPLWDKGIPHGFSLCPMFWMSILIGFMFLRCFFVPLFTIVGFITKKTIVKLDARYTEWFNNHLKGTCHESTTVPECGMLLVSVILGIVVPICLFILSVMSSWFITNKIYDNVNPYIFWWTMFGAILSIGCMLYYDHNKTNQERCKTSKYIISWAGIFVIMIGVIYHAKIGAEFIHVWTGLCKWTVIIWQSIWEVVCVCISSIGHVIVWFFATGDPLGFVFPPIAILICFGLFMYIVAKLIPDDTYKDPEFASEYQLWKLVMLDIRMNMASNQDNATHAIMFTKAAMTDEMYDELENCNILRIFIQECIERLVRQKWKVTDIFGKDHVLYSSYKALRKRAARGNANFVINPLYVFKSCHCGYYDEATNSRFTERMVKIIKETYDDFDMIIGKKKKKIERKNKSTALCNTCTNVTIAPFKFIWWIVKELILFIAALAEYTWDVTKAKKKGFCPYIQFKNVDAPKSKK